MNGISDVIARLAAKLLLEAYEHDSDATTEEHDEVANEAYRAAESWVRMGISRGHICSCENCIDDELAERLNVERTPSKRRAEDIQ